jgi:hypothetical protein
MGAPSGGAGTRSRLERRSRTLCRFSKSAPRKMTTTTVRQAAVQELARGWKDDKDTLPILKERATKDDDNWAAPSGGAGTRSRLERRQGHFADWLKERATKDDDNYVRLAAVQELARGWKDDKDTLPIGSKSAPRKMTTTGLSASRRCRNSLAVGKTTRTLCRFSKSAPRKMTIMACAKRRCRNSLAVGKTTRTLCLGSKSAPRR